MQNEQINDDSITENEEINEQLEGTENQQQNQSSDWTSGIDVIEIGSSILNGLGDLLSGIDISF